ncbi:MAG: phosphomannomutase/phosphoglucomutase [Patescibacteria group bacterium]|jgi:phosphomannomutase
MPTAKIDPAIFKAYDIRGVYPKQINTETAKALGRSFACFVSEKTIIVGRDMRASGQELSQAFINGVLLQGKDVINIGKISTDCSYFASGKLNLPAAMFTASHNPASYNGIKFSLAGAQPLSSDTGLLKIRDMAIAQNWPSASASGKTQEKDILPEYINHALSLVASANIKNLSVAVDAGNGMAGKIIPLLQEKLSINVTPLYFELDGTFPNHEANPIKLENVQDLIKTVKEKKADIGLAFDGDADRVFFIDEKGARVSSSLVTAMIAEQILIKNPKAAIIYNVPCSKIVSETIERCGGKGIKERVGHSFIKATMKKYGAIFGGEHSGHYYFKDNYFADSGLIAALFVLEIISKLDKPFSQILEKFQKYFAIEETNSEVTDKEEKIKELKEKYKDARIEEMDGVTFMYPDYWFNVRPSNTEPALRLNLEANTEELKNNKTQEILNIIRQ